ncbi:FxLYD domain-containing protein [Streptomyces sp. NPDC014870]|uniref:FxLYD domain-containing protein n=1 Tax=Streptomyces sp. NPDC014870 TaxID=3364925 RepID=UPI003702F08D
MSHQQSQPGWGQPQPGGGGEPPRRTRSTGKIIGLSCLGLIAVAVALVAAVTLTVGEDEPERRTPTSPATPQEENGPRGDVRIAACEVDSVTKWPSAELLITNRSSKASTYMVQVEFVDAANRRLSEAYATTNNVAPGQQSRVTAQSLDQVTVKISCRITDVTRFAS